MPLLILRYMLEYIPVPYRRKEEETCETKTRSSSKIIVVLSVVVNLLHPMDKLFRLASDFERHWWQFVIQIFESCGIECRFALGVDVEKSSSAVGESAHDGFCLISKARVPRFVDGCVGGGEDFGHQRSDVIGVIPDAGRTVFSPDAADERLDGMHKALGLAFKIELRTLASCFLDDCLRGTLYLELLHLGVLLP